MSHGVVLDTMIWIRGLRDADQRVVDLFDEERALLHPYVRTELLLGGLSEEHHEGLSGATHLDALPAAEVDRFIIRHGLARKGLGFVDAALLAAAVSAGASIWTDDGALGAAATRLRRRYRP
jgi:predicted nucleic acid-binding protein